MKPSDSLFPTPTEGPELSVVAPCFNEEVGLREFHRRVSAIARATCLAYEIVLVDDGSRDRTWDLMLELAAIDPQNYSLLECKQMIELLSGNKIGRLLEVYTGTLRSMPSFS